MGGGFDPELLDWQLGILGLGMTSYQESGSDESPLSRTKYFERKTFKKFYKIATKLKILGFIVFDSRYKSKVNFFYINFEQNVRL